MKKLRIKLSGLLRRLADKIYKNNVAPESNYDFGTIKPTIYNIEGFERIMIQRASSDKMSNFLTEEQLEDIESEYFFRELEKQLRNYIVTIYNDKPGMKLKRLEVFVKKNGVD